MNRSPTLSFTMLKTFLSLLAFFITTLVPSHAAVTNIRFYNTDAFELRDFASEPLFRGDPGSSDGDLLQVGYYTLATTSDPFLGSWVPLIERTIGGKGVENYLPGRYDQLADLSPAQILLGVPLSLRFYDSPTLNNATRFNAVSDVTGAWNMINSPDGPVTMTLSLADSNLIWADGGASAFHTTIPVPEPAGLALLAGAVFLFQGLRMK